DRTGAVSFLRAYLYRIAANLAIDRLRGRARMPAHEDPDALDELPGAIEPVRTLMAAEEIGLLDTALSELPQRHRRAFELSRLEDMTHAQIAVSLGLSERMIRNYLVYAMTYCRLRMNGLSRAEAESECKR